jgi:hypothetical protein
MTATRAKWIEARWGKRGGHARRASRQPFAWTCLYEFVPDDGEALLLAGEVLSLGVTKPRRREAELGRRKGPYFHAVADGRVRGVARAIPGGKPSLVAWDFLGDDGVARVLPDTRVEVFQSWGADGAWNVWKAREAEDTRNQRRRAFLHAARPIGSAPVRGQTDAATARVSRPSSGITAGSAEAA